MIVVNIVAENVLSPMLMGRGLNLSPTVVFLSFILWAWVLGGPGAFLAVPITLFVIGMLETFPETRWLASLMRASAHALGVEADRTSYGPGWRQVAPRVLSTGVCGRTFS